MYGYWHVYYPDFEMLFDPNVDLSGLAGQALIDQVHETVKYAYNDGYLAVQPQGDPAH